MPDPLTTAATAWAWDKYGKSLTDKAASALKARWVRFRWRDAAEKYRAKVKKLYGTMQIMGMAEPVSLDDIFTEVYLLDKPTAFSRFDIERLKQAAADPDASPPNAKRIGGLALVKRNKHLFILGKPGAGKTTFLKYITIQATEPNKPVIDKVPIFIALKQWVDSGAELIAFIEERFNICDFPDARRFIEELLKSGNAIVLFDGLDEVNQEGGQRDKQTGAMNNFIEKYENTQCLITCRIAASDYSFKPFTYVEIADFAEKQIRTFVGNWFRNKEGEREEETSARFLAEFSKEENKGLRDLARTPLLLTLLCLAFDETLAFPQRRVEIYEEALDALLKKWDATRRIKRDDVYRKLSLGHKENMLARIAAETFDRGEYFILQDRLERLIADFVRNIPPHDITETTVDGEAILKAIEHHHGLLVGRAHKVYSFSHLTFHEYFTAKYIVANAASGTLTNLIEGHCRDRRWYEVFLLTTSLLPDASRFMVLYRRAVDDLLGDDEKLRLVLAWARKKSASIQTDPWFVRPNYLFIELYYPSRNQGLANSLGYALDLARIYCLDRNHDRELVLDHALASTLDRASDLVFDFHRARSCTKERDFAVAIARDLGLNKLAENLAAFSVPVNSASVAEWRAFADKLRPLIAKHRDIRHNWGLTEQQEARLAEYVGATVLLQNCLELAYMPPEDKKAMLSSLYLPPPRAAAGDR